MVRGSCFVVALVMGVGDAQVHAYRWDARDGSGAHVRAGIYGVRLVTGSRAPARRLVLLGTE